MQIKVQRHAYYLGMNSFAAISGLIWFQPIAECFGAIEQLTEMKTNQIPEIEQQIEWPLILVIPFVGLSACGLLNSVFIHY